jgi:uncharacterized protein YndB with AHSA1/START domain
MNIAVANTTSQDHVLRVERLIAAPPERVFAYWTQAELVAKWLAPGDMKVIDNEVDLQPGGVWYVTMRGADGRTVTARGIYLAIEPSHRLVFTWGSNDSDCARGSETEVEVVMSAVPGGTQLVLTHRGFDSVEQRDRHEMGWTMCVDKLERTAR